MERYSPSLTVESLLEVRADNGFQDSSLNPSTKQIYEMGSGILIFVLVIALVRSLTALIKASR